MAAQPVQAGDERLHAPEGDALWSESYYVNFCDGLGVLGGFTRIGLHPSRDRAEGLLCVYLPDGGVGIASLSGPAAQPEDGCVRAGALRHECVEPLHKWRIRYDGDVAVFDDPSQVPASVAPGAPVRPTRRVQLDVEATGLHAPFFYPDYKRVAHAPIPAPHGRSRRGAALRRLARLPREMWMAVRMRSGRHYEQSVAVRGIIAFDGSTHALNGSGHRDHSWGLRDWGVLPRMRWLTGQMEGLAFNALHLTIGGTHVTNGYVSRRGECAAVDELHMTNTFDSSGVGGRELSMRLTAGGDQLLITGQVLLNVPLPITGDGFSTMYTVGRTRYRCGDRVGYGVAEFLERLDP